MPPRPQDLPPWSGTYDTLLDFALFGTPAIPKTKRRHKVKKPKRREIRRESHLFQSGARAQENRP